MSETGEGGGIPPESPERESLAEKFAKAVVSVTPSKTDNKNMVLSIYFFQDGKQVDSRGYCTPAHVSAELPNQVMEDFLCKISEDPDLLEDFYQKSFAGLDSRDGLPACAE